MQQRGGRRVAGLHLTVIDQLRIERCQYCSELAPPARDKVARKKFLSKHAENCSRRGEYRVTLGVAPSLAPQPPLGNDDEAMVDAEAAGEDVDMTESEVDEEERGDEESIFEVSAMGGRLSPPVTVC